MARPTIYDVPMTTAEIKRRARGEEILPAGWTSLAEYRAYLQDADGGRAPFRALAHAGDDEFLPPDTTPTVLEVESWRW